MAFTNTWNANFEALPPDTGENISQGANRIRALKNALRERLEVDHYWDEAGTDADHGEHTKIRFHGNQATPANVANKSTLYPQLSANKLELFYKDNANQVTQLTSNGAIAYTSPIPANTVMLFYADTAPTGWTIDDTVDDKAVMVTCGSANGGETGGGAHANGTWTMPLVANHIHEAIRGNATSLTVKGFTTDGVNTANIITGTAAALETGAGQTRFNFVTANGYTANPYGGATNSNTWRPAAYCFIMCSKD